MNKSVIVIVIVIVRVNVKVKAVLFRWGMFIFNRLGCRLVVYVISGCFINFY